VSPTGRKPTCLHPSCGLRFASLDDLNQHASELHDAVEVGGKTGYEASNAGRVAYAEWLRHFIGDQKDERTDDEKQRQAASDRLRKP
jgi:hypothetical protein